MHDGDAGNQLGVTEADWVRWVGVITAIVGSVVAAPSAGVLIIRQAAAGAWAGFRWLLRQVPLVKHLPFLRPATSKTAHGQAEGGMRLSGTADGLAVAGPMTPTAEQLEMLWSAISRLYEKINQVSQDAQQRDADLAKRLDTAVAELRTTHQATRSQWEEERRRAVRIDARGLPLIGLGVLMTGLPDGLATWHWLGWLVIAVAVILMVWLAVVPLALMHGWASRA